MKNILLIVVLCVVTNIHAGVNKCISGNKISYQSMSCYNNETVKEFSLKYDISKEQIQAARKKQSIELADRDEKRRLDKIAFDRERLIRAEEDRVREARFQTDEMIEHNRIERNKRNKLELFDDDVDILKKYRPKSQIQIEEDCLKGGNMEQKQPINSKRLARVDFN